MTAGDVRVTRNDLSTVVRACLDLCSTYSEGNMSAEMFRVHFGGAASDALDNLKRALDR